MKQLFVVLFTVFLITFIPVSTFAMKANDPQFEAFLKKIGWDKQDYLDYLKSKDWDLDYFDSGDELGTPLTEKDVQSVLKKFNLTREELNTLLIEFGDLEKGQDVLQGELIIFAEDLHDYVKHYLDDYTLINEKNLQDLLTSYEIASKQELENILVQFDDSLENYKYLENLESIVDLYLYELSLTPINDTNFQELLKRYGFNSKEELETFLNDHGDSMEYFKYMEELEDAISFYQDEVEFDEIYPDLPDIGLSDAEIGKLLEHFLRLDIEDSAFLDKLLELQDQLASFESLENVDKLSKSQIIEFKQIYQQLLELFQIDIKYYLVKDNEKKPVSFDALMTMYSTDGYDLLLEIYNKNGELLADLLLYSDLFDFQKIIEEAKDEIEQVESIMVGTKNEKKDTENDVEKEKNKKKSEVVKETNEVEKVTSDKTTDRAEQPEPSVVDKADGEELPKTASPIFNMLFFGSVLLITGFIIYRRYMKISRG
ncbi:processed acidic surface protein [Virgibacillus sp. SK37]|uniref:processed acidic surface protein n=1 Tax=Virgibacillus sp. SK37 TaxID=403957 RepID=UPI00119F3ABE|nr:processed acidic surface protein [Virgibacillus sp. SK37]